MKTSTRFTFIGLIVLIALVASIALPITALADGAPTPPPASDSSGSAQPADTSAPAQPADTSAPTEPPPAVDTSAPPASQSDAPAATQDPGTAVATDTPAPADTNSPAATDTPVVVVNSDGTVEPLATQDAADVIATGDPIWCAGTIAPGASGSSCTKSYKDLYSLVNAITTGKISQPNQDGIIWITAGTDTSAHNISIDGIILSTWAKNTLTLNGGWDGSSTGTIIGTSDFSKYISITDWTRDVTINDITISGTNSAGLTVTTTGNINIKDVTSGNNKHNGAYLDNSKGSGNIAVNGGTNIFSDNQYNGLEIYSNGYVTLNNVIADSNKYDGALLRGGTISVTGKSEFNRNKGNGETWNPAGLEAYASGAITLTDVKANGNGGDGAYLDNTSGSGNITINGSSNIFNNNDSNGLEAYSKGTITLNNVTAGRVHSDGTTHGNWLDGALLINSYTGSTGDIEVDNSTFNDNFLCGDSCGIYTRGGLEAYSNGNITLSNVTAGEIDPDGAAHGNLGNGAYLDNCLYLSDGVSGACTGYGTGTIEVDNSTFNDNSYYGLAAYSNGNITLSYATVGELVQESGGYTAFGNGWHGANLYNSDGSGTIEVDNSTFNDNDYGLYASSSSDIILDTVTAGETDPDGIGHGNYYGAMLESQGGNVAVNSSIFNNNYGNGLTAYSTGYINLTGTNANRNGGDGANLNNFSGDGDITVSYSTFGAPPAGESWNGNGNNGLEVYSNGNVALNYVTADYNDADGALLGWYDGPYDAIGGNLNVTGGDYSYNHGNEDTDYPAGLEAYVYGTITLTGVNANSNSILGASLESYDSDLSGINVSSSNFKNNGTCGSDCESSSLDGLDAFSSGDITLTDVNANSNTYGTGVLAASGGNITLNNVAADYNTDGAYLSAGIFLDPNIEINNSHFNYNSQYGLEAAALGNVTLNNTDAIGNGLDGADLITFVPDGAVTVNCGHYNDNTSGAGINDEGSASLTLNGVELSGNSAPYLYGGIAVIGTNCNGPSGGSSGRTHAGSGNIIPVTGLPIHTIDVSGGEGNGLDCTQYGGTQLILPNNDSALFPCPISDSASLGSLTSDKLPGALPNGDTFGSSMTTKVIKNGASNTSLNGTILVSFSVPDNMKNAKLAILFWDGSKWVEVSGHMTADGHFETATDLTGTFVLVSK